MAEPSECLYENRIGSDSHQTDAADHTFEERRGKLRSQVPTHVNQCCKLLKRGTLHLMFKLLRDVKTAYH